MGAVFLLSALGKLRNPRAFAFGIEDYEILPERLAFGAALFIIVVETLIAIAHITGQGLRLAVPVAVGLLGSFAIAVGINLRRGRLLLCYCFDTSGGESISRLTLFRLLLLVSTEIFLLASPRRTITQAWIPVQSHGATAIGLTFCWITFVLLTFSWLFSLTDVVDVLRGVQARAVPLAGGRLHLNHLHDQASSDPRAEPLHLSGS